jgi:hypothetical protein
MATRELSIDLEESLAQRFRARAYYQGAALTALVGDLIAQWLGDWGTRYLAYTIQAGEDLRHIAEFVYGDPELYWTIAYYNDIEFPVLVKDCQNIAIPEPEACPANLTPSTNIPLDARKANVSVELDDELVRRFRARASFEGSTSTAWLYELIAKWVGNWPTRTAEYTVQPGDDLTTIAFRYYLQADKVLTIAHFNGISVPAALKAGQHLRIPEPRGSGVLPKGESPYIYGVHDQGGESLMVEQGRKGWVLITEAVGSNPHDQSSRDYSAWENDDFGVIVRLNHGYHDPDLNNYPGTIPEHDANSQSYQEFAVRCANFVQHSSGCHIWIIGNEMNHPNEWPGGAQGSAITPQLYADCFRRCYSEIHLRPGRQGDQVVLGAVAPWNASARYPGNLRGDWVRYLYDVLLLAGNRCDGIALHTYTHGPESTRIAAHTPMWPPFEDREYEFRAYQQFMDTIPTNLRHLPVYITETNQNDPWSRTHTSWVEAAYAEINAWNQVSTHQRIRCLLLYRWLPYDQWSFAGIREVTDEFRAALVKGYRWW